MSTPDRYDTIRQKLRPKRRWYQFSLRTLLVVMLVSCFVFAWIGSRMRKAQENRARVAAVKEAVAAIEELGGEVTSAYKELRSQTWLEQHFGDPGDPDDPVSVLKVRRVNLTFGGGIFGIGPNVSSITDADLEYLKGLRELEHLELSQQTNITDAGLEHLEGLTNLEELDLTGMPYVTDAGLKHLKGLTNLKRLSLGGIPADAGLEHLKGLNKLQSLSLGFTNVTDAGLKHLKGLTNLKRLDLSFNYGITDAGLEHLKGLKRLKELFVGNTNVTDEGVEKLQQALPNCEIDHVNY